MLNYPKTFKDAKERSWTINISGLTYLRLRDSELKIDIEDLVFVPQSRDQLGKAMLPLVELCTDVGRLMKAVYEILKPEAERLQVSFTDFADALDGNAIMAMKDSFIQGVYDFFHSPQKRLFMEDAETKGKAMMETMEKRMISEMPKTTEQMVTVVNLEIDRQLKKFYSDLPASLESVPSPSVCDSSNG